MRIGNKTFENGTYIMGIMNFTPDSFYGASRVKEKEVLQRAEKMIIDGASVLDLGAQSTRPNYFPVSASDEISRLLFAVEAIKSEFDIPVSIDTDKCVVARVMLANGADMINDIWGLQQDELMSQFIAEHDASVCIMHNAKDNRYTDMFKEIRVFFEKSLEIAKSAGIDQNKIILDGGIGFAKDKTQNWQLLENYEKICVEKKGVEKNGISDFPLLLGTSRKSMFGGDVENRLQPTLASTRIACQKKVLFVRVHDVAENKKVIDEFYRNA